MLKKILIILLALLGLFAVAVMNQPDEFLVSRTVTVNAPADKVFPYVNDLHQWEKWSPWAKIDPAAKMVYEGPASGPGAVYRWSGNNQVGEGSNTIMESRPNESIKMKLEFLKPFKGTNDVEFAFEPQSQGNQTLVTWTMSGKNNFISKAVGLIMNCQKMVGGQFEKGLAQLKAVVEK